MKEREVRPGRAGPHCETNHRQANIAIFFRDARIENFGQLISSTRKRKLSEDAVRVYYTSNMPYMRVRVYLPKGLLTSAGGGPPSNCIGANFNLESWSRKECKASIRAIYSGLFQGLWRFYTNGHRNEFICYRYIIYA